LRIALPVALLVGGCATLSTTGSLYRSRCVHVGIRPADMAMVDDSTDAYGLSVRVSTEWGPCSESDAGARP
jgi:hypothetical protein